MRQAHQTPFATDLLPATPQEAAEPTRFFDLTIHRFHDDLASGLQGLAFRRPHLRSHPLLRRGRRLRGSGLSPMVPLALGGDVWIKP